MYQYKSVTYCFFMICLLIPPLFSACAVSSGHESCVRENTAYCTSDGNFTGQWYDYYERALSCMEGECYPAALADLEESIYRRSDDRRMARSLGMHFVDYFPHREKGLIHYLLGEDAAAESELELSIQQYPSAKALFYLDKVRKRIMEKSRGQGAGSRGQVCVPRLVVWGSGVRGQGSEESPLTSHLSPLTPDLEIYTAADPVVISGIAEDEQYVSEIMLNNRPVFMEASGKSVSFRKEILLAEGKHRIDISAKNLLGGTAERRIILHADRAGPVITLTAADAENGIQGRIYDESGEIFLTADGKEFPVPKGKNVPFSIAVQAGTAYMLLSAKDKLGNQTEAEVSIESPAEENLLMADAGTYVFETAEKNAYPKIILDEWQDRERVFLEHIQIKGKVRSENLIRSLNINDMPLIQDPGTVVYFSYVMRLEEGENRIRIIAEDESGSAKSKVIAITREIPEAFKMKYRYCLALHPFDLLSITEKQAAETEANLFQHFFSKQFNDRKRFQIMMRKDGESVKRIFNSPESDLNLILAGRSASVRQISDPLQIADAKTDRNRSAQIRPDAAVLGNLYKTRNGIEIAARFVDIQSGEILAIEDAYSETADHAALASLSETLAEKFHRKFPMTDARITQIQADSCMIKPEKRQNETGQIKMKWPLIVYRQTVPMPRAGADAEIIGDARIDGISDEYYRIKMTAPREIANIGINEGDRIITR